MSKKENTKPLSPKEKALADKIHQWAFTDGKKEPKKFEKLFNEIWDSYLNKQR